MYTLIILTRHCAAEAGTECSTVLKKDRPRLGTNGVLCAALVLSFPEKLPHQCSVADTTISTFGARQSGFSKKPPISCQSGQCSWELTHGGTVSPSNCRFLVSLHFQGGALILTSDTNHGGGLFQQHRECTLCLPAAATACHTDKSGLPSVFRPTVSNSELLIIKTSRSQQSSYPQNVHSSPNPRKNPDSQFRILRITLVQHQNE